MDINLGTAIGVLTLAKYHRNQDSDSTNRIVTRTLGKFGIINKEYKGEIPKEDEFWLTRIVDNIKPNEHQGCFIVEPVKKVSYDNVGKLLLGMYEEILPVNDCLIFIKPVEQFKGSIWQLALEDRKKYKNKSVIVIQDESLLNEETENG